MPWKNGKGLTSELALWPASTTFEREDFDARISCAAVSEAGPFSRFAGCHRVLVILSGEGLLLDHGDRAPRARLRRLEPYGFSGDWPTEAALLGGEVRDFNVITRHGRLTAEVQCLRLGSRRARETLDARHGFLHVFAGSASVRVPREESAFFLAAGESLRIDEADLGDEFDLQGTSPDTELLIVRLRG